ncbi:4-hydroxy-tetrahydrodipicolinate synthase [Thalassobacillus pellis]|uniref:4-hydroxy-tetrahydrodipicolinate synthase n=1 Tax=Thalassobacillus pellis TaxID=748008 RepID=UPI001961C47C|nr:4-hydroxy-tetrahydrodipicolinate synthase [Thalassobacillus pellis]MBM7552695.1 4-hydroxy-tetrahydrodipicolinate synthase [Thalassobacillus pellis]
MDFGRVLTAMVTPFDSRGSLDLEKTTKLIEYLIANGTDGLVITGTTGESPTLTRNEKRELWEHTVKVVNKRIPVIAGTGCNDTNSSVELTKEAEASGVDAVMLVTPYYNKPDQRGLFEHFKTIAAATNLPVMLYNIPGRSVVSLTKETVLALAEIDNIVSIKDASGDMDTISKLIEDSPDDFSVYSGEDSLTLPIRAIGGDGIVSVASHIIGKEMQEMLDKFDQGEVKSASNLHRQLVPLMNELFLFPSPAPVKAALKLKGIDTGGVRLPLVPLSVDACKRLSAMLHQ